MYFHWFAVYSIFTSPSFWWIAAHIETSLNDSQMENKCCHFHHKESQIVSLAHHRVVYFQVKSTIVQRVVAVLVSHRIQQYQMCFSESTLFRFYCGALKTRIECVRIQFIPSHLLATQWPKTFTARHLKFSLMVPNEYPTKTQICKGICFSGLANT